MKNLLLLMLNCKERKDMFLANKNENVCTLLITELFVVVILEEYRQKEDYSIQLSTFQSQLMRQYC
jgi:hypothetical protein